MMFIFRIIATVLLKGKKNDYRMPTAEHTTRIVNLLRYIDPLVCNHSDKAPYTIHHSCWAFLGQGTCLLFEAFVFTGS